MEKQFVVFKINNEEFGVNIIDIQEICHYQKITTMPQTKKSIKGVINYRGSVIPVMDVREFLELSGETTETHDTRIIILLGDTRMGLLVDEASQTIKLDEQSIEPAPPSIKSHSMIKYIGKIDNRLISLIDFNELPK